MSYPFCRILIFAALALIGGTAVFFSARILSDVTHVYLIENGETVSADFDGQRNLICRYTLKRIGFGCRTVFDRTKTSFAAKYTWEGRIMTGGGIRVYSLTNEKNTYRLVQESHISDTSPKKIAVLYISTGRYIRFWKNFYTAAETHFLPRHKKTYFLFTDHDDLLVPDNVVKIHQDQLPWPYITLKRYHFFIAIESLLKQFDYIYFLNGNAIVVQDINEEIFPTDAQQITVTLHPGFYRADPRHVTYDRNPRSRAFIPRGQGTYYVMGGFNGGTAAGFLEMSKKLKAETDIDLQNNVMPRWHDESMLNRYVVTQMQNGKTPLILMPVYGIPQTGHEYLNEFRPFEKIRILDKSKYGGHTYLRGQ